MVASAACRRIVSDIEATLEWPEDQTPHVKEVTPDDQDTQD